MRTGGRDGLADSAHDHHTARGSVGEQQLGNAESGDAFLAAEDVDLLLAQLERRHVPEDGGVEIGVEHERAGSGGTDQSLSVECQPSVAGERGEHVRGEVRAGERADLHPVRTADGTRLRERPRRARVGEGHLPLLARVAHFEGRRTRSREPVDPNAECGQRAGERPAVGLCTAGDDP